MQVIFVYIYSFFIVIIWEVRLVKVSLFSYMFIKFAILVSGRDYGNKEKVRTERN